MKAPQTLFLIVVASLLGILASLYWMANISTAFILGFLFAYLCLPLVTWLEKHSLSRTLAVLLTMVLLLVTIVFMVLLPLPLVKTQFVGLWVSIPAAIVTIKEWGHTLLPMIDWGPQSIFDSTFLSHWKEAGALASLMFGWLAKSGSILGGLLTTVVLTPLVMFYILRDWDHIFTFLHKLLPAALAPTVTRCVCKANEIFSTFVRGQLLVIVSLAALYSTGLSFAGLELALVIGVLAGVLSIIPYLGMIAGLILAVIAWLLQGGDLAQLGYIGLVFAAVQIIETAFLTPYFVGDKLGLHPLAVLFALLIGGKLFGIAGMLFSLPVMTLIVAMIRSAVPYEPTSDDRSSNG